ncbi:MAG TPA: hypothetical protein VEV17_26865 [Bryobacteraceae bacterium]|nr:hypothetical protein [Bryobacteraceae bacterium]
MIRLYSAFAALFLAGACLQAQSGPGRMGRTAGPGGPGDFAFLRAEFGFAGKVVTGAPYSAQALTQFNQTLADGTHIQRSSTAAVARDSQGRTRSERNISLIGPLAAAGRQPRTTVMINDPVGGVNYVLDANSKTYRQMQAPARGLRGQHAGPPPDAPAVPRHAPAAKTEDLGTQVIQGVSAQGTRVTRTIAAGQAGNDRPIEIVTETWIAPDLQVVVMSKTSDPRFGDSVYQLTNISRVEPDPSLFSVPSGYTVQQGRQGRPWRSTAPAQNQ